jgi:hypothetical protein
MIALFKDSKQIPIQPEYPAFKGLDNAELHFSPMSVPAPFSPLVTKWQFSGQLVYKNTQRLAIKALVCLTIVVGIAVIVSYKLGTL